MSFSLYNDACHICLLYQEANTINPGARTGPIEGWLSPPIGCLKVNVDAGLYGELGSCTVCMALWLETRMVIYIVLSRAMTFSTTRSLLHAEVKIILFAVETLSKMHMHFQELESDSLLAISTLCKELDTFSSLFPLLLDILHFNSSVDIVTLRHINRIINKFAHRAASYCR